MKRYKILQVTSCFNLGGTESYIMNNYRNINREKYQFDFWIFIDEKTPYSEEIHDFGGEIYFGIVPKLTNIVKFTFKLVKHLKVNGPYDAVHAHVNVMNFYVMLAAKIAGVKNRISHSHATSGINKKNFIKRIYHIFLLSLNKLLANHKLACSTEAGYYLYGEKYFTLYGKVFNNGINVKKFQNKNDSVIAKLKESYNIEENSYIIGNITRFDYNKNTKFAIDVFYEIQKKHANAILILGGIDGGTLHMMREKVINLELEDKVKFIGATSDVENWLQLIDAYIFPSYSEGLGIALLEAQAAGLTCFISDTISTEVDVGLGLIHFINLNKGAKYWAEYILEYKSARLKNTDLIRLKFKEKGYLIESSVIKLENIYNGEN